MIADPLNEQRTVKLKKRLWGAAVLIALAVIFLPLLLDGSGSESQYRRVERLRAEPPRILGVDGQPGTTLTDGNQSVNHAGATSTATANENKSPIEARPIEARPVAKIEMDLSAWVVQAGSFNDKDNAIAVRDRLRGAGFPSFLTPSGDVRPTFRVQVGPMIDQSRAQATRDKVMALLGREAILVSYP